VDILKDLGLGHAVVGAELSYDYMTNIPYEVRELAHDAKVVDANDILLTLRMIKTRNEVEALREVALRHTTALQNMAGRVHGGMTVKEVGLILAESHREQGASTVGTRIELNIWNVDGQGEWLKEKSDPNRKLRKGDYVSFDSSMAGLKGYGADFGATFVVGAPLKEHLDWWEKQIYIVRKWMEASQPHVKMCDAHKAACQAVRDVGLDPMDYSGCFAVHRAHFAHGTGIDTVEQPYASRHEQREFEPGMTLCIEPGLEGREAEGAPKTMHREEIIVITEDGYERLTTMDWDLHSVPEQ